MKGKTVFQSLSSGSCGNCYFLHSDGENGSAGILIDAGVSLSRNCSGTDSLSTT